MTPQQKQWIDSTKQAAQDAGHVFPQIAACEAALESAYGQSGLARNGNNLFGVKQHSTPIYETLSLPTKEFINRQWITVQANWVKYPDLKSCFADRMATLRRLSSKYPHYAAALAAQDEETFVREVSQTWSTDPNRADKVLSIEKAYLS